MAATDDSISIREHLETAVRNQREYVDLATKRNADAVVSLESRMTEINALHATAHAREHEMTKDALDNAAKAMNLRLAEMNEFRKQITDERATFLTKAEFMRFEEGLDKRIATIEVTFAESMLTTNTRIDSLDKQRDRLMGGAAAFGGLVTVLSIVGYVLR